jgi:hypothetical protein
MYMRMYVHVSYPCPLVGNSYGVTCPIGEHAWVRDVSIVGTAGSSKEFIQNKINIYIYIYHPRAGAGRGGHIF